MERASHAAPRDPVLNWSQTGLVIEPEGSGDVDDSSPTRQPYTDAHYWNFCTAGAVAATIWYWNAANTASWPAGNFTEPAYVGTAYPVTTYWASTDTDGHDDDGARTYSYIDTCGANCGSGSNGGLHTVDQGTLYQGILDASNYGSGVVW